MVISGGHWRPASALLAAAAAVPVLALAMAMPAALKVAAYTSVDLTSYSGHTGSLSSWWVRHKLLANTGQQSGRDWVAVPGDLYSGGASLQTFFVPQSAQSPGQPSAP